MQEYKRIVKPCIYNKESELDTDKAIELLKSYDQLYKKANKPSKTKVITKLRGLNKKCLQFEMAIYVIEDNDKILSENINLADRLVEKVNQNIKYNLLRKQPDAKFTYNTEGNVVFDYKKKKIIIDKYAIELNDKKDYFHTMNNLFTIFLKIDDLSKIDMLNESNDIDFSISNEELKYVEESQEEIIHNIIEKDVFLTNQTVLLKFVGLEPDKRYHWTIVFKPRDEEGLFVPEQEIKAKMDDGRFLTRSLVEDHEGYHYHDTLECDINYKLRIKPDDLLPEITKVVITKVHNHITYKK